MPKSSARLEPAGNTITRNRTFISGKPGTTEASNHWPVVRDDRIANQHTEAELKLIRDMRRRNPKLERVELWGAVCASAVTADVWKVCGAFCGVKDWQRRKKKKKIKEEVQTQAL